MEENRIKKFKKKRRNRRILYVILGVFLVAYTLFWKAYNDVNRTSNNIFNGLDMNNKRDVVIEATQPISFAFLGIDNGSQGRDTNSGRSDAILVGTINPETEKTTLVSIPRDSYSLMVGYEPYPDIPYYDKLTHAYAFGESEMAINSIQEYLNVPIDYYVEVNMQGLVDIVNALDGITVTSPLSFKFQNHRFYEGETMTLDGSQALAFARMRKDDPEGDFGRQKREKMVIQAIIDKALSLGTIANYKEILDTLENNVKTNLTFKDIQNIYFGYAKSLKNFETNNLVGEELWLDEVYYLYTYPEDRLAISNLMRSELEIENITLEELSLSEMDLYNLENGYFEYEYVVESEETYNEY